MTLEQIQYPVGKWIAKESYTAADIQQNVTDLVYYASQYHQLTSHLTDEELAKTYREGSWSVRQVIHHVADTHLWHFLRIKQALTEDNPAGIFGNVNMLAVLPDYEAPVADSLAMLISTHNRYADLFTKIHESSYPRTYFHPFRQINVMLPQALDMTVWHSKHHLGHIKIALGL